LEETFTKLETIVMAIPTHGEFTKPAAITPQVALVRTSTGFTLGAVGGMGTGLLLQEIGQLGRSSSNPYLSTAAIACTLLGAATGGMVGVGLLKAKVEKWGAVAEAV